MKLFDEITMIKSLPKDYAIALKDMYDTLGATIYSNQEDLYLRSNELASLATTSSTSIADISHRIDELEEAFATMRVTTEELGRAFQAMSQRLEESRDRIQAEKEEREKQELYKEAIKILSEYINAETEKAKSDLEKIEPIIEDVIKTYDVWGELEDVTYDKTTDRIEFGGQPIFYR